jgi:hypothetical protein
VATSSKSEATKVAPGKVADPVSMLRREPVEIFYGDKLETPAPVYKSVVKKAKEQGGTVTYGGLRLAKLESSIDLVLHN